jgi:hypothetical protein
MVGTTMIALPVSILAMAIVWIIYAAKKKSDLDPSYIEGCFAGIGEKKAE